MVAVAVFTHCSGGFDPKTRYFGGFDLKPGILVVLARFTHCSGGFCYQTRVFGGFATKPGYLVVLLTRLGLVDGGCGGHWIGCHCVCGLDHQK